MVEMKPTRPQWKLFQRVLVLFFGLGVVPSLVVAISVALPVHFQFTHYRMVVGILFIIATVAMLCLAGIIVNMLKRPINAIIRAQHEVKAGNLKYRIPPEGSLEMQNMFRGFNDMAAALTIAAENEKRMAEERSLTRLASQVVHDIRSPLASLKVACDYFESQGKTDPEGREHVKLLQMGIQRLLKIAEGLLNQRRNEAAQAPTLLHDAVDDLLAELSPRYDSKKLEFKTDFHHPAIPLAATKIELQRLFGNIITNAIEAMRAIGTIQIRTTDAGQGVCIQIEDNGPGMTDDILQKVLRGGFTYGKMRGNGVGMTVVREIVEKYNGLLRATSTPGMGTTFLVEFPLYSPGTQR
jgi:signal transduction histidine kinase